MEGQIATQNAGTDFDKWLDWDGTADATIHSHTSPIEHETSETHATDAVYPISPSTTANSDGLSSAIRSHIHTAPSSTGPLTPIQSSGSPDTLTFTGLRFSGDTLRDDTLVYQPASLKRKLSSSDDPDRVEDKIPKTKITGSKRPHNVIEKRYRANLNDKIAELRDSVPSLRVLQKVRNRENGDVISGDEDIDGPVPIGKLNKASILTKAVEYIHHLEFRNRRLEDENKSLKERLQILDRVLAKGGNDAERANAFTTDNVIEQSTSTTENKSVLGDGKDTKKQVKGLISAPDNWKRMRQNQSQEHYGHVYQNPSERPRFGGKWTSRVMLGSLAGLMVVEGFSESNQGSDSREKGLFGIPLEILDGWTFLRSPRVYLATFAEYCHAGGAVPLIKGFLALTILAFFVFTYLFNSRPHPEREYEKESPEQPQAARPASPIEVRRRAWSTSMQALGLPHHSFFPEWLAITSEWISYSIRYLLGPHAYAWLTGRSSDDEIARIKAWDIAIDAQLAGGDIEISRSRVLLSIFGAGTLPRTPMRLMQKALHCRVLLWNVGVPDTITAMFTNRAAVYFANRQWRKARQLHERLSARDVDRLPGYLNYLLQMDCDEIFTDQVTQRAYNLMYDRPTSEYADNVLMDVVAEDHAIRSPLDAIAAWRSTCALHEALSAALQCPDSPDVLREHIQSALEIAPPGSAAETRALTVHAVLSPGRRSAFYSKAMDAMSPTLVSQDLNSGSAVIPHTTFIDSSTPASARPEIVACLRCAKVMLTLEQERNLKKAVEMAADLSDIITDASTMLIAAPLYFVISRIWRASGSGIGDPQCESVVRKLKDRLQAEQMKTNMTDSGLNTAIHFLCATWDVSSIPQTPMETQSRRNSMLSNDTGYVSLSELDEQVLVSEVGEIKDKSNHRRWSSDLMMTVGVQRYS